jgi:hypothetical protein
MIYSLVEDYITKKIGNINESFQLKDKLGEAVLFKDKDNLAASQREKNYIIKFIDAESDEDYEGEDAIDFTVHIEFLFEFINDKYRYKEIIDKYLTTCLMIFRHNEKPCVLPYGNDEIDDKLFITECRRKLIDLDVAERNPVLELELRIENE